jgi:hypothetical protein
MFGVQLSQLNRQLRLRGGARPLSRSPRWAPSCIGSQTLPAFVCGARRMPIFSGENSFRAQWNLRIRPAPCRHDGVVTYIHSLRNRESNKAGFQQSGAGICSSILNGAGLIRRFHREQAFQSDMLKHLTSRALKTKAGRVWEPIQDGSQWGERESGQAPRRTCDWIFNGSNRFNRSQGTSK